MAENETPTPKLPEVAAAENALVGDENLPDAREPTVEVEQRQDPAQTTGEPAKVVDTVEVFEVAVSTDEVIVDPHSPLAVQVPDAGRGSLLLPIHTFVGARRVEDVFAEAASDGPEEKSEAEAMSERTGGEPVGR